MDSIAVATVAAAVTAATSESTTEAGSTEASVVEGLRAVVAAVVEALRAIVAAVVEALRAIVAAVVEALGASGGLSETSGNVRSLSNGSAGGSTGTEAAASTDELSLRKTDNGGLALTTWDGLSTAEASDGSVRSAGGSKASRDEVSTEGVKSGTS